MHPHDFIVKHVKEDLERQGFDDDIADQASAEILQWYKEMSIPITGSSLMHKLINDGRLAAEKIKEASE